MQRMSVRSGGMCWERLEVFNVCMAIPVNADALRTEVINRLKPHYHSTVNGISISYDGVLEKQNITIAYPPQCRDGFRLTASLIMDVLQDIEKDLLEIERQESLMSILV